MDSNGRQFGFLIRGLRLLESKLTELGIPFFLFQGKPEVNITKMVNDAEARLLIVDYNPLRIEREWRINVSKHLHLTSFSHLS